MAQKQDVDRGFVDPRDPSKYVLHKHRTVKIPERWEDLSPQVFFQILDDIANRYPYLNTKDLKATLQELREELVMLREAVEAQPVQSRTD